MSCKDCIHYGVCIFHLTNDEYKKCFHFKDKADVVEVRRGEWHYNPDGMDWGLGAWECSLCRCKNDNLPMDEKINPRVWAGAKFCPSCGAKMDGERKGQG